MNHTHSSVILVTGAATGIGQLTAHSLAEAGHTVYACMRDIGKCNTARAQQERDYATARGIDLRIKAVASKENEITATGALLHPLLLKGRIISADAMHTQKKWIHRTALTFATTFRSMTAFHLL
jgi:NAD(P)-dependent dehydrogenase (short-subunit alcohol dehydrogenase family)